MQMKARITAKLLIVLHYETIKFKKVGTVDKRDKSTKNQQFLNFET